MCKLFVHSFLWPSYSEKFCNLKTINCYLAVTGLLLLDKNDDGIFLYLLLYVRLKFCSIHFIHSWAN